MDKEYVQEFANVLAHFQDNIHYCKKCGHICEGELCEICKDETRDQSVICVVESPKDVFAMEKVREYHGLYHVLHGTISMIDGKTIDDLNINSLFERLDGVKEVINVKKPRTFLDRKHYQIKKEFEAFHLQNLHKRHSHFEQPLLDISS